MDICFPIVCRCCCLPKLMLVPKVVMATEPKMPSRLLGKGRAWMLKLKGFLPILAWSRSSSMRFRFRANCSSFASASYADVQYNGWPISTGTIASIPKEMEKVKKWCSKTVRPRGSLFDYLIHGFYLAVGLGMGRRSKAKTDLEVGAKLLEFGIIKLPTVVCDNGLGYAEATYDILSNESFNVS
ncbi:unnamed protein product [Prunus brigantina]